MALEAQAALLPYALVFFAFGLTMFAWASSYAANGEMMILSLAIFAINWGVFYALASSVRRSPAIAGDPVARTRIQVLGALLWAAAIGQISVFALGAGPARESLLILAAGGAMACYFFLAPVLPTLLTVGPIVAAGPVIGLFLSPATRETGIVAGGALALTMALSIVVNRILARQYALNEACNELAREREKALETAQVLARSKSALLTTLSDEVRNGLLGVTHVLAAATGASARSAPSREQLAAALGATRDLVEVLNATLDVETADAGRLDVRQDRFDAARLARDIVYLNQPQAAARGLELEVFIDEDLESGAVTADAGRTRQVLAALIANALKYTPRGRVEVRVRREGGDRVRFEVADTGPGLSHDEIGRAFEPFERIERTSAGATGAGLGLSLSRALAELMGGAVSAHSAQGAGSCFWLELPYDAAAKSEPAPQVEAAQGAPSGLQVVVSIEDRLSGAMVREVLESLGHRVVQAQGANRARDLLLMCDADLVIAASAEAVDILRGVKAPILVLVDGDPEETEACRKAGCAAVIRKPVSASTVARAIASLDLKGEVPANAA